MEAIGKGELTCDEPGYELVMVEPLGGYDAADNWGRHVAAVTSDWAATVRCLLLACGQERRRCVHDVHRGMHLTSLVCPKTLCNVVESSQTPVERMVRLEQLHQRSTFIAASSDEKRFRQFHVSFLASKPHGGAPGISMCTAEVGLLAHHQLTQWSTAGQQLVEDTHPGRPGGPLQFQLLLLLRQQRRVDAERVLPLLLRRRQHHLCHPTSCSRAAVHGRRTFSLANSWHACALALQQGACCAVAASLKPIGSYRAMLHCSTRRDGGREALADGTKHAYLQRAVLLLRLPDLDFQRRVRVLHLQRRSADTLRRLGVCSSRGKTRPYARVDAGYLELAARDESHTDTKESRNSALSGRHQGFAAHLAQGAHELQGRVGRLPAGARPGLLIGHGPAGGNRSVTSRDWTS